MSTNKRNLTAVDLLVGEGNGIRIPQVFVTNYDVTVWGLSENDEDVLICQDPDHEWYWEAWDSLLNKAKFTDKYGNEYFLYQDGALWGLCPELMSDQELSDFGFERN